MKINEKCIKTVKIKLRTNYDYVKIENRCIIWKQ